MKPTSQSTYIISGVIFLAVALGAGWIWQTLRTKPKPLTTPSVIVNPNRIERHQPAIELDQRNLLSASGQVDLPNHTWPLAAQPAIPGAMGRLNAQLPASPKPPVAPRKPLISKTERINLTPLSTPLPTPGSSTQPASLADNTPDPTQGFKALLPGDSVRVPLEGEVKTEVYDTRTNEKIASGVHKLTGTAVVTADNAKLKVETNFNDTLRIGVTPPEPAVKRFHLGAAMRLEQNKAAEVGGYLQYDIPLYQDKSLNWLVPVRLEHWREEGWRGSVGVELNF